MIQLTKDLVMDADSLNYIVGKPVQRPGSRLEIKAPRYYPSVGHAIRGALSLTMRRHVADGTITTLKDFLKEQERLLAKLTERLELFDGGGAAQSGGKAPQTISEGNYTSSIGEGA